MSNAEELRAEIERVKAENRELQKQYREINDVYSRAFIGKFDDEDEAERRRQQEENKAKINKLELRIKRLKKENETLAFEMEVVNQKLNTEIYTERIRQLVAAKTEVEKDISLGKKELQRLIANMNGPDKQEIQEFKEEREKKQAEFNETVKKQLSIKSDLHYLSKRDQALMDQIEDYYNDFNTTIRESYSNLRNIDFSNYKVPVDCFIDEPIEVVECSQIPIVTSEDEIQEDDPDKDMKIQSLSCFKALYQVFLQRTMVLLTGLYDDTSYAKSIEKIFSFNYRSYTMLKDLYEKMNRYKNEKLPFCDLLNEFRTLQDRAQYESGVVSGTVKEFTDAFEGCGIEKRPSSKLYTPGSPYATRNGKTALGSRYMSSRGQTANAGGETETLSKKDMKYMDPNVLRIDEFEQIASNPNAKGKFGRNQNIEFDEEDLNLENFDIDELLIQRDNNGEKMYYPDGINDVASPMSGKSRTESRMESIRENIDHIFEQEDHNDFALTTSLDKNNKVIKEDGEDECCDIFAEEEAQDAASEDETSLDSSDELPEEPNKFDEEETWKVINYYIYQGRLDDGGYAQNHHKFNLSVEFDDDVSREEQDSLGALSPTGLEPIKHQVD